jgi:hypothetical protein
MCIAVLLAFFQYAQAQTPANDLSICSTEKVNSDCRIVVDRDYPVNLPTIQMRSGRKVKVQVVHPLPFETLTLDLQSTQLLPGTDQIAGVLTALIPDLKGFSVTSTTSNFEAFTQNRNLTKKRAETAEEKAVEAGLEALDNMMKTAVDTIGNLFKNIIDVYAQLKQIMSTLPRPLDATVPAVPEGTPNPWSDYSNWRAHLICELAGGNGCMTPFLDVIGRAVAVQAQLPTTTPPKPMKLLFDSDAFDMRVATTRKDIQRLPQQERQEYLDRLQSRIDAQKLLNTSLITLATNLPNIIKDLQGYYGNINLANSGPNRNVTIDLGSVFDPRILGSEINGFLGRQVAFSINAVNQISTSVVAVPAPSQKTSLETITVLYANPIFEVSAGALFSTLPNRTFTNQTTVTPAPGGFPSITNVSIIQADSKPEILPFAAANWRLGPEFVWPGGRRGAVYFSLAAALNPYNALPEFGGGFSLSWRALLFTPMYHLAHGSHLTQGETPNMVWCNSSATAGATPPPCSPAPPAPSTKAYWTSAFGLGVSVRIPTSFSAGTGGVSR